MLLNEGRTLEIDDFFLLSHSFLSIWSNKKCKQIFKKKIKFSLKYIVLYTNKHIRC